MGLKQWLRNRLPRFDSRHKDAAAPKLPDVRILKEYDVFTTPSLPPGFPTEAELGISNVGGITLIAPCEHPTAPRAFTFAVGGEPVNFGNFSMSRCAKCFASLIARCSLTCGECGKPIPPSMYLFVARIGAPQPFTHPFCAENSGLLCGALGFGRIHLLHDLDSNFPEGTATQEQEFIRRHNERLAKGGQAEEPPGPADPDPAEAIVAAGGIDDIVEGDDDDGPAGPKPGKPDPN
jgi:hypothetical protein